MLNKKGINELIKRLEVLDYKNMYENDFFLTWEKTDDELEAIFTVALAFNQMRKENISTKSFLRGNTL